MSPDKAMIGYLQARIAELEAEVERLSLRLEWHHANVKDCSCRTVHRGGVNPSGDTLGRKEREDG